MTIRDTFQAFALFAALVVAPNGDGQAAGEDCRPELAGAARIESKGYVLAYRTEPAKIRIGEHFMVDFIICAKDASVAPTAVRVDATMPEHRHGMNYRPSVTRRGPHQFRAEGLLFHMPGRWDFSFEVQGAGTHERITHAVTVR